jgi:NmrA-like family protein
MQRTNEKLIAVIGATGQQGGSVVHALQASSQFKVRALTRNPDKHRELADEVVKADLNLPETLKAAFEGVHGVFLVTNFWEEGTDERKEATAAVRAAKDAGVKHFVWSTLPNVEAISGGKFDAPHFTGKAKIDRIVKEAGFVNHTFVIAPMYYQGLVARAPQKQPDGSTGWALPIDPTVRCLHMGDITELGNIVAGAFAHPDESGNGEYLPLVGDFMSFNEIVWTPNRQGHKFSFKQVPKEVFVAASFPGAAEIANTFSYFQAYTYLGSDSRDRIAFANKIAGRQPTKFAAWARLNVPVSVQPA